MVLFTPRCYFYEEVVKVEQHNVQQRYTPWWEIATFISFIMVLALKLKLIIAIRNNEDYLKYC